jgi:hypothetical protein
MRLLCYTDGSAVPSALRRWAAGRDERVEWRNGRLFESPERRVDVVVTDLDPVREAYEEIGVEVKSMPVPGKKNEATRRRYVTEDGAQGWTKVLDRKTGEYVKGASSRDAREAQRTADKMNANG